jgi:hypothetical protein
MERSINLLWTGGWDSTFRLLQLLLKTDAEIRPIYLVDDKRPSSPREIEVMRRIRHTIERRIPGSADRIRPTRYGSFRATVVEAHHLAAWDELKKRGRVGSQYPVLASYAEQNGIKCLELGIDRPQVLDASITPILMPLTESMDTPTGPVYRLRSDVSGPERMFERFHFPLLDWSKSEMKVEVEAWGMQDIMRLTWSCYRPTLGLPCGKCHPCRQARADGFGHRIGILGPSIYTMLNLRRRLMKRFLFAHLAARPG